MNNNTNNNKHNKFSITSIAICILLFAVAIELHQTNRHLEKIAENGTEFVEVVTYDDTFIEIETEESKKIEDYLPFMENITEELTTKVSSNKKPSTTTNNASTTNKNNVERTTESEAIAESKSYVLNISSKKIHAPSCSFVPRTKEENKKVVKLTNDDITEYVKNGYTICKTCGGK